jgi:hypothetical protein
VADFGYRDPGQKPPFRSKRMQDSENLLSAICHL